MTDESQDWEDRVAELRAQGAKEIAPNGLRICCIRADGTLLEHEEADYPAYMFPVTCDYVGNDPKFGMALQDGKEVPLEENFVDGMKHESHALIHTDGVIAVTVYERCFYVWRLKDGKCAAGPSWLKQREWKLREEDCVRCCEVFEKRKAVTP